jgi:hypothetical protein
LLAFLICVFSGIYDGLLWIWKKAGAHIYRAVSKINLSALKIKTTFIEAPHIFMLSPGIKWYVAFRGPYRENTRFNLSCNVLKRGNSPVATYHLLMEYCNSIIVNAAYKVFILPMLTNYKAALFPVKTSIHRPLIAFRRIFSVTSPIVYKLITLNSTLHETLLQFSCPVSARSSVTSAGI